MGANVAGAGENGIGQIGHLAVSGASTFNGNITLSRARGSIFVTGGTGLLGSH